MAFDASLEMTGAGIAKITLAGELDAAAAPRFKEAVERAAEQHAKRLVLLMGDLEFVASAGLRVLIFAKQKMGSDVDVFIVSARDPIVETIRMTGFHHSVVLLDEYDTTTIETL
jgi:anti-sigma B factor antagonist